MKGLFTGIVVCLLIASFAYAGSIVNSRHNLSLSWTLGSLLMQVSYTNYGEVCVYCHTPHGGKTEVPLWNRNLPSPGSYNLYNSSTMDNPPDTVSGISLACLSCHDGTIAVDQIINAPGSGPNTYDLPGTQSYYGTPESLIHYALKGGAGGCGECHTGVQWRDIRGADLTTDLSNDHPISMAYPTTSDFEAASDVISAGLKLYNNKVECASCHDVHNPDIAPFLRISNGNSALCTACHIK